MSQAALASPVPTIVSAWNVELISSELNRSSGIPAREQEITLVQFWNVTTLNQQILIFFSFLILFTLNLLLQYPILESHGAQMV